MTNSDEFNLVFHLKDEALFKRFIENIPRDGLLTPLRRSKELFLRYFRGYRLSDTSPALQAMQAVFRKEIMERHDGQLISHLCHRWLLAHSELSTAGLRSLGIEADLAEVKSWLPRVHEALPVDGSFASGSKRLVKALAFDFEHDDIAILVSIFSHPCKDQSELQQTVYDELTRVVEDPEIQKEHLEDELRQQESVQADVETAIAEINAAAESQRAHASNAIESNKAETQALDLLLHDSVNEVEQLEAEHSAAGERLQRAKQTSASLDGQRVRLAAALSTLQTSEQERADGVGSELGRLADRLSKSATETERLRSELERVQLILAERPDTTSPEPASNATVFTSTTAPILNPGRWLNDILEDVYHTSFSSSCLTLELVRLKRGGVIPEQGTEPGADLVSRPTEWQQALASYIVYSENRWSRNALSQYALAKAETNTTDPDEVLADALISGLYHAGRVADVSLTQKLLATLVAVASGNRSTVSSSKTANAILESASQAVDSPELARIFGSVQAKLATANPRALLLLFDAMSQRPKIALKRALVGQVSGFGLDERDPTHELLDVVNTRIAAMVAPLSSLVRATWRKGSISTLVAMRDQSLRASKAMIGVFSADTDRRLQHFRQLLGQNVTTATREHSPDSYGRLVSLCRDFVEAELRNPEWVSSRYLVPIALELARCAVSADIEVRETLQATIVVEPDKIQQPIGASARDIEVGLTIKNVGTATGTDLELVIMPSGDGARAADIKNPELRIATLPVQAPFKTNLRIVLNSPIQALELDYLVAWRDPSHERKEASGSIKLTAQRSVDWSRAAINPYSLRSITNPERLFGRESAIDKLRSGVLGMQSCYLTGQKRVGKSSVGRVLHKDFSGRRDFISLYVTLGELQTDTPHSLMSSLLRSIGSVASAPLRDILLPVLSEADARNQPSSTAFIGAMEQHVPEYKILCVIDDFDELDEKLYRGPDSQSLFLQFRALIDRGFIAFVFVGSERLPEILRYQGERLNQVSRHSLDYLSDHENIARLVRQPSADVLEFDQRAVERIAFYSAGNPYYATQICRRVYEDLIARRDHYASLADVERSVAEISDEESVSTFQHFWKDGVFGAPQEAERFQHLNALVLLALGKVSERGDWTPRPVIEDDADLRRYSQSEIRHRVDELVERHVVNRLDDRLQLRVPLFSKWLAGNGSVAVRTSFGERQWESLMAVPRRGVLAADIVAVSRDLIYQGVHVNELRIKAWLEQFGDARSQELAFQLLRYVKERGYYDDARLFPLFKRIHSLVIASQTADGQWAQQVKARKTKNLYVSHVDREGKSGAAMVYGYRTANQLSPQLTGSLEDAAAFLKNAASPSALVLVDDFIGTGDTFAEGIDRLEKLVGRSLHDMGHTPYAIAALGLAPGIARVESATGVRCFVGEELGSSSRAFSPDSGVFLNDDDRRSAEALCRTIGEVLEPKHSLGYADCQSVVVFSHRCPNNSLPIFHKPGRKYQGTDWVPLFPRD